MAFTSKIAGLDNLSTELQAAARLGIHDGMELLGVEGARLVQENIGAPHNGRPAAVDTGNLMHSVVSDVTDEPAMTRLIIGISPSAGAEQYAGPVETGAAPHMPPVESLVPWVMRKLDPQDEKHALSLAWAVARSIQKRGTQGVEMFERAEIDLEPMAVPVLERAIAARLLAGGGSL